MNAQNKSIAPNGADLDEMTPLPFGVMLPFDSDLRFLVLLSGYGIPKEPGLFLEIGGRHGPVFLPYGTPKPYFLRGTFTTSARKKVNAQGQWSGTLTLPNVALSRFTRWIPP